MKGKGEKDERKLNRKGKKDLLEICRWNGKNRPVSGHQKRKILAKARRFILEQIA